LLARIEFRVAGVVSPAPAADGGFCDTGAVLNWGSPSDSLGPCGGYRPRVASEGSLTLEGGEGQGVLVVDGDLRLRSGARYAGVVLVSGDLTLDGGALLQGLARVRGSVRVVAGSRLAGAFCPALLALEAGERLRRPLQIPGGGWIRPL
jgi:hypothetical protein